MSPLRRSRRPNDNRVLRGDAPHIDGSDLLVFDADPLSLLATAGALHTAGHRCVCARNASAAHQAAGGTAPGVQRPSAIVMDVGDDATAALQTLEALRQLDGNASMPAVLIATADWAGLEKQVELIQSPTRCLFKPLTMT